MVIQTFNMCFANHAFIRLKNSDLPKGVGVTPENGLKRDSVKMIRGY